MVRADCCHARASREIGSYVAAFCTAITLRQECLNVSDTPEPPNCAATGT